MGFRAIEAAPGRNPRELIVSISKQNGHLPRLRVSLHAEVAAALGWQIGMRLEPLLGDGPDHGLVKIRPALTGFKLCRAAGHGNRVWVTFRAPAGSPDWQRNRPADYTTDGPCLTLMLPWAVDMPKLRAIA